jgi:hypothetical protein
MYMKKQYLVFGVLVMALVLGLVFTGCDGGGDGDGDGDGGGGGGGGGGDGGIPTALVGTWGKQVYQDFYQPLFVIDANGTGTWGDPDLFGSSCSWSVVGNKLTLHFSGENGTIDWAVNGSGQLELTGTASGALAPAWSGATMFSPLDKKSN